MSFHKRLGKIYTLPLLDTLFPSYKVAVEKFSSSPVEIDESEEKPARVELDESEEKPASEYNIPDASSISAFMTQVADLIECVIFFC